MALKSREPTESINLNKETEGSCSNRSENSSDNIKLDISRTPAIDSPPVHHHHQNHHHHHHHNHNHNPTNRPLFPTSLRPPALAQLFQTSSRSSDPPPNKNQIDTNTNTNTNTHTNHHQIGNNNTKEESSSLSNMFCGMDDHSGFWPWLEQQHFN